MTKKEITLMLMLRRVRQVRFSQEEVLHDVGVIFTAAVREITGCKHNDGIQSLTIIT